MQDQIYFPHTKRPSRGNFLLVRVGNRPAGHVAAIRKELADIVGLVLRTGAWLVGVGALIGALLTYALGAGVEAMAGFATGSVLLPLAVAAVLTAVALLAAWLPARRATRIDPVVALRCGVICAVATTQDCRRGGGAANAPPRRP